MRVRLTHFLKETGFLDINDRLKRVLLVKKPVCFTALPTAVPPGAVFACRDAEDA